VRFEYVGSIARRKGEHCVVLARRRRRRPTEATVYITFTVLWGGHEGARGPSCPADSYDPALSRDCVSPRTMRRPPCPPCDRWTPMRAVERRRALSPFPACGNSRRRPSARVENPLVRCLPAPDRRMFHGNGPRDGEPRANRGENSLVARYTVGMENIVYGTKRFGCMLEQPPASLPDPARV